MVLRNMLSHIFPYYNCLDEDFKSIFSDNKGTALHINHLDRMVLNPFELNQNRFLIGNPDLDPDANYML